MMAGLEDERFAEDEIAGMTRACRMGAISASFMIEQYGIAQFDSDNQERWNGELPLTRLTEMENKGS